MKVLMRFMFVSILMIVAAPAWSDSALHIITCEQDEETSDEKVEEMTAEWFKAAKAIKGGENIELYLYFPIAAKVGEVDLAIAIIAPSFAEWGTFMDNYPGSAAEAIDDKYEDDIDCANGTLWESVKVE